LQTRNNGERRVLTCAKMRTVSNPVIWIFAGLQRSIKIWRRRDRAGRATMEFEANCRNWDGIGQGSRKFWSPLRDWDTGILWKPGQRFRVTCRGSKHFRRRGMVLKVSRRRLTVEFGDDEPGCFVVRSMVVHFPPAWAWSPVCHEANRRLSWG
jgi:hypothetical protein